MSSRIGIFGGTFDPVHLGHLSVAWEAAELLDAEVRLIPASIPPHRPPPIASAAQRVVILRTALQGQSRLSLDTRELDREGPSYTVDTLVGLRTEQGARPLVLLIGADAFANLASWDRWRELFDIALPSFAVTIEALRTIRDQPREAQRLVQNFAAESMMKVSQAQLDLDHSITEREKDGRRKRRGRAK